MSYYDHAVMMELSLGRWKQLRPHDRQTRHGQTRRKPSYLGYFWLD